MDSLVFYYGGDSHSFYCPSCTWASGGTCLGHRSTSPRRRGAVPKENTFGEAVMMYQRGAGPISANGAGVRRSYMTFATQSHNTKPTINEAASGTRVHRPTFFDDCRSCSPPGRSGSSTSLGAYAIFHSSIRNFAPVTTTRRRPSRSPSRPRTSATATARQRSRSASRSKGASKRAQSSEGKGGLWWASASPNTSLPSMWPLNGSKSKEPEAKPESVWPSLNIKADDIKRQTSTAEKGTSVREVVRESPKDEVDYHSERCPSRHQPTKGERFNRLHRFLLKTHLRCIIAGLLDHEMLSHEEQVPLLLLLEREEDARRLSAIERAYTAYVHNERAEEFAEALRQVASA